MESRSKFACLNIDDDSDEEFTNVTKGKKGGSHKTDSHKVKNGGSLIVHSVEKRPKAKRGPKAKVVDDATGLVVQDADENYAAEQKFREDLKRAMRESAQLASSQNRSSSSNSEKAPGLTAGSSAKNDQENPSNKESLSIVEKILSSIEDESRKLSAGFDRTDSKDDSMIIALYRSKLTEAIEQTLEANEKAQAAQADVEKYRMKYRKLVELFRDAELSERAKLVMDLERARTAQSDLGTQLAATQKEVEQYKSKLRSLGALK
ncbi:unnamed protein product [Cylicocyclus nassatus]|uniref:Uncharacterized protein n=1 Tax=Cylicocyclus nassatus TaxID=53992 RepID=A0AA36GPY3_CYLNA|nr:unnamed protein product [Cylicocyclus nassatus]